MTNRYLLRLKAPMDVHISTSLMVDRKALLFRRPQAVDFPLDSGLTLSRTLCPSSRLLRWIPIGSPTFL